MPFPVTVSAVTQSAEAPGKYGPFLIGSDRYEILVLPVLVDAPSNSYQSYFSVYKSSDGGTTWVEVFAGSRPQAGIGTIGPLATPYTCAQSQTDSTKILVFYVNSSSNFLGILEFDTSAGWNTGLSDSPWQLFTQFPFISAAHRAFDNTMLAVSTQGVFEDSSGETHFFPQAIVYDVAGDSWGTPFDLGYSDYASVIGWHQVPCGIALDSDGVAHVFSQQVTHAVQLSPKGIPTSIDFTAPWDCTSVDIALWGDGGGGGGASITQGGAGGAAGQLVTANVPVTPLSTLFAATVGTGGSAGAFNGADGGAGTGTSYLAQTATGGAGGITGGGSSGITGGGGGGDGSDTSFGAGTTGSPGVAYDGFNGGANGGQGGNPGPLGSGSGGTGGSYFDLPLSFADVGGGGQQPGGGGGGGASNGANGADGGAGGAGEASASYQPTQGSTYNSRLWQQAVNADNSLGTLAAIDDGEFPIQSFEDNVVLMPFDCAAGTGFVVITFSGAYNTVGNSKVEAMRGDNADPISFTGQLVNAGSVSIEPSPAIAVDSLGKVFCAYKKITSLPNANFVYRKDDGTGFGSEQSFGLYADPFCRVQIAAFSDTPELTFGTSGNAFAQWLAPT